jgi:protein O-mannosyl-transferase
MRPALSDTGTGSGRGTPDLPCARPDTACSTAETARCGWRLAPLLLITATIAAYSNSFGGPFIFDDESWIVKNSAIQRLWPIQSWLLPSQANCSSSRPVIALTLAVNYALGGTHVWGYHAVNLAIHALAALTIFGILRRTLTLPKLAARFGSAATPLALAVATLWAIHPLQTQAVTYIVQRCESLMGLFYLLTLYCVIRGAASRRPGWWHFAALTTCLLGMATKEVMVTAPLVVLLYDRTFLSGSFRGALRARCGLYVGMAASWAVAAGLLTATRFYGGTAGFAVKTFTWWSYLQTQCGVLVHYLKLALWPTGLCLDYAWPATRTLAEIAPLSLLSAGLLALSGWALVKRPAIGFLGAWFFIILAPSSSIVPIADAAFDHRMYLPLAAVITAVVLGGYLAGRWLVERGAASLRTVQISAAGLAASAVVALGMLTFHRNRDYHDAVSIWQDTVAKRPNNARAHSNLACGLIHQSRFDEAIVECHKALRLSPGYAEAHNNLGYALCRQHRFAEALPYLQMALELKPDYADAYHNLGVALAGRGNMYEAMLHYQTALELDPKHVEAHVSFGDALAGQGHYDEAMLHYQEALRLDPHHAEAIRASIKLYEANTPSRGESGRAHFSAAARLPTAVAKCAEK